MDEARLVVEVEDRATPTLKDIEKNMISIAQLHKKLTDEVKKARTKRVLMLIPDVVLALIALIYFLKGNPFNAMFIALMTILDVEMKRYLQ